MDAPLYRSAFALFKFGGQQGLQVLYVALFAFDRLRRESDELGTDGGQVQGFAVLPDGGFHECRALC